MKPTTESIRYAIDALTTDVVQKCAVDNRTSTTEALRSFMKTDTFKLLNVTIQSTQKINKMHTKSSKT